MSNHEVNQDFDKEDANLDSIIVELEKMSEEIDKEFIYFDFLNDNYYIFDQLYEILRKTEYKIKILDSLINNDPSEQYLIDLYICETIGLFEGLMHNFFAVIEKRLSVVEYQQNNKCVKKFNIKSKNKNSDIKTLLNSGTKKTLNNPFNIVDLFKEVFDINIIIPETTLSKGDISNRAIEIRNAHIHKNGVHKQRLFSFEEALELKEFYVQIINQISLKFAKKQTDRIES